MNLELRTEILSQSLIIEANLSGMLAMLFRIRRDGTKTLGSTGSALSFKNKVDLLYDLERIDKITYERLILFMEVRNQFMHNYDADNFKLVIERLGKKQKLSQIDNSLLKTHTENPNILDEEQFFKLAFEKLYIKIAENLQGCIENIIQEIKKEKEKFSELESYKILMRLLDKSIDEFASEFEDIWKEGIEEDTVISKIIKGRIMKILAQNIEKEEWIESTDNNL